MAMNLPNSLSAPATSRFGSGWALAQRWLGPVLPLLLLVALLAVVGGNAGLRAMLAQAWRTIDARAVLYVLPLQLLAIVLCTAAQQALKVGVPFRASFVARLVRDAAHNLLIVPPGLGEVVGARALVLLGGRGRAAVALRVLDIAAEVVAELPYMALAGWVIWRWWQGGGMADNPCDQGCGLGANPWALGAGLAGVVVAWRGWRGSAGRQRWQRSRAGRRLRAETHLMARELRRQRTGLPLAVLLHCVAWGMSGVQVWVAAKVFGLHLSLFGALAIESAATSARLILFFVPGGLVMQEAGAVLAGAAMGVAAPQALALSLVLRLRDVCFGTALLIWPWLEYRARQTKG
jgi:hypothetical protein